MNKQQPNDATPRATTNPADHSQAIKIEGNAIRYVVPGLYLTPFGNRRGGCLKARS